MEDDKVEDYDNTVYILNEKTQVLYDIRNCMFVITYRPLASSLVDIN